MSNGAKHPFAGADEILTFWFDETKPFQWFRRNASFDETIRTRFGACHEAATTRRLDHWMKHADTALTRIIILDQFSRNIYRDDPRAYAHDGLALAAARDAVARKFDQAFEPKKRAFILMPFMHAEDLVAQNEGLTLFKSRLPGADDTRHAQQHRDIIARFDRFPHRNKVLGRKSTAEEIQFLKDGGFNP